MKAACSTRTLNTHPQGAHTHTHRVTVAGRPADTQPQNRGPAALGRRILETSNALDCKCANACGPPARRPARPARPLGLPPAHACRMSSAAVPPDWQLTRLVFRGLGNAGPLETMMTEGLISFSP